MQTDTILYIILSGIIALSLALFQYKYKSNKDSKLNIAFSFLRFITIFSVLLLLVNPQFEQTNFYIEKPNLVIAIDNSSSIKHLKQDAKALYLVETLTKNIDLNNKFHIETYSFGENLSDSDSILFNKRQTNIDNTLNQLSQIYKDKVAPTMLITDGNQTFGYDYETSASRFKQPIYAVVLGDTIVYTDLKIEQLNVNKYAYLKNEFPVEAILVYNGNSTIGSKFEVFLGSTIVYSENVSFSKNNNSKIVRFNLPANQVGASRYRAHIVPIKDEKNTINNNKNFAIEVIDQKTNIALVSDILHPDLGALKKSIESNEQRSVSILKPNEFKNKTNDFQLVILYSPNNRFKEVFTILDSLNTNRFVVVGPQTDLNFLNTTNKSYSQEITNQTEFYQAELNKNYVPFIIEDIDFESFPPLKSVYGTTTFSVPFESILEKKIGNTTLQEPLLASFETSGRREAVLFGENIWQWRAQHYINTKSFNGFDNFIGKLIQYIASNIRKNRLNVEYESFYNGNSNVVIKAQFFDENYIFDAREALTISVKDLISNEEKEFPLNLKNTSYKVNLSSLKPSDYSFKVTAASENVSQSGLFQILEYEVEQQFLNANATKLQKLAANSKGRSYFIDDTNSLINDLLNDNRFVPIQKSNKNVIPLIDWKYMLFLIALSLSIEWFLRKYNGLI